MNYRIQRQGDRAVLSLTNQLIVSDHAEFDGLIPQLVSGAASRVVVDLSGLEYMDSAGLGFLLTLREKAEARGCTVILSKPAGAVRELLELARFDTLFAFE